MKKKILLLLINAKGRDNARTPIQWDDTENAGFTIWYTLVTCQSKLPTGECGCRPCSSNSIFYCYQKLIQLRKENPIVVWGDFEFVENVPEQVFMYLRHYEDQTWAIVANIGEEKATIQLTEFGQSINVISSNYERTSADFNQLELKPYEAFAVKLIKLIWCLSPLVDKSAICPPGVDSARCFATDHSYCIQIEINLIVMRLIFYAFSTLTRPEKEGGAAAHVGNSVRC